MLIVLNSSHARLEVDRLNKDGRTKQNELARRQGSVRDAKEALQKLKYDYSEVERLKASVDQKQIENASLSKELDLLESRLFDTSPKISQAEDV